MPQKILLIAGLGDLVLRAGGTIAAYAGRGWEAHAITPVDGEPEQQKTLQNSDQVAQILGISSVKVVSQRALAGMLPAPLEGLAADIRRIRPDIIITYHKEESNAHPGHTQISKAVLAAYNTASGSGAHCGGYPTSPRQTPMFGLEAHQPEADRFRPGIYIDTSDYITQKEAAMQAAGFDAKTSRRTLCRAQYRASQCAALGRDCEYAEVFSAYGAIMAHGQFVW